MNEYTLSTATERTTRGATAVEYALIVALIAGVIIAVVGVLGTKTEGLYNTTTTEMTNAGL
jgi:Flp pilus assembly pilin Flp